MKPDKTDRQKFHATRGPKTHRADQKLNRGDHREAQPKGQHTAPEGELTTRQEELKDEHPTRMTQAGYRSRHGNRR
jgi:hypothetical protein